MMRNRLACDCDDSVEWTHVIVKHERFWQALLSDLFGVGGPGDDSVRHDESEVRVLDGSSVDLVLDGRLEHRHHLGRVDWRTNAVEGCGAGRQAIASVLYEQVDGVLNDKLRQNGRWRRRPRY